MPQMFDRTLHDERASILLKQATAKKKSNDFDGAVDALNAAYVEIALSELGYPIETFIRLPQILHLAGKSREAWKEFNKLLFRGFPNQAVDPSVMPMERSILFDKMRLFLEREKQEKLAGIFSILSAVSWRVGLQRQGRLEELAFAVSQDDYAEMAAALLDYSTPGVIKQLCITIAEGFRNLHSVDYDSLGSSIEAIIASAKQ